MKQKFFDQLDGGWSEIITDTYKDAETTTLDYDIDEYGRKYIDFGQHKKKLKGSVIVPEGVLYIDYGAFSYCKIEEVILPKSLKFINPKAFSYCDTIEFVEFNEGIETIDFQAFFGCRNLKSIKFPESLTYIGEGAFQNSSLEGDLIIPDKVKTIEDNAFKDCINLNGVLRIGKNIEYIGNNSFEHCNFKKIYIPKELEYYNYKNIYKKNVEIIKY